MPEALILTVSALRRNPLVPYERLLFPYLSYYPSTQVADLFVAKMDIEKDVVNVK